MILYFHTDKSNAFLATLEKYTSIIYIHFGGCETSGEKWSKNKKHFHLPRTKTKTFISIRHLFEHFLVLLCRLTPHSGMMGIHIQFKLIVLYHLTFYEIVLRTEHHRKQDILHCKSLVVLF